MLDAEVVRALDGDAHVAEDRSALPELERRREPAQLESLDELHDDDGRRRVGAELEHLHDARVRKQRERPGLAQKPREARADGGISTQDLRRHDPIELQILELVHLAHPAGAEAFDRAEAFESRQRRRLGRCRRALATRVSCGVEGRREGEVAIRQRLKRLRLRWVGGRIVDGRPSSEPLVLLDELGQPRLEV